VGEIALIKSVPRTATVTAALPSSVLALDRGDFLAAVAGHGTTGRTAATVAEERLEADRHRGEAGSDTGPGVTGSGPPDHGRG
jgi:CRP-like cAMP-binding protein